jgi:RHS repeat-associated protein
MNATKNWLFALLTALWVLALPAQAVTTDIYYHNDLAGSPIAATDSSGTLLWRQGYKPYGERINPKAPSDQQPWFVSKAYVEGAGLAYFGARWYDPQLGRFMGIDPKGFDEANVHSFNRYAYANDNPYRYVDPDGKNPLLLLGRFVGGGAIGGGLGTLADAASQYAAFREVDWGMAAQSSAAREGALAGSMSFLPAGTPVGLGIRSVEEGIAAKSGATVIGKLGDLKNIAAGERTLLDRLPNLGSPKANWYQNSSVLRQEMSLGQPIRDATVDASGRLINNTGFLRAERKLLETHGWTFDSATTVWMPPVP